MKIHFPTWHEQILESKHFLEEFIEQTEKNIVSLETSYETEKETHIEEDAEAQEYYYFEHYRGFDNATYDVEQLFKVHFPNLHRRSGLITLYSFLEVELNKLCEELRKESEIKLTLKDLSKASGDIERATNYLTKVIGLPWDKSQGVWSEIKKIQNIRNKIVHNDGKIDNQGNEDLINYIVSSSYLFGEKGKEDLITEIISSRAK